MPLRGPEESGGRDRTFQTTKAESIHRSSGEFKLAALGFLLRIAHVSSVLTESSRTARAAMLGQLGCYCVSHRGFAKSQCIRGVKGPKSRFVSSG